MPDPSVADQVFGAVAAHGALSVQRIYREYGPRPTWEHLVNDGHLRIAFTPYGPVAGLTPRGHQIIHKEAGSSVPYIGSSGHLADRAYLMDALQLLERQGYSLHRYIYKHAGQVGTAAKTGRDTTDQIVRTEVVVPELELRRLRAYFPAIHSASLREQDLIGPKARAVGHPSLYATISNGGITPARLKVLLKRHRSDLDVWRTPLIIATSNEALLRPLVRSINGVHRTRMEAVKRTINPPGMPPPDWPIHDLVTLINLPGPKILHQL